jgi:hypothetical protein
MDEDHRMSKRLLRFVQTESLRRTNHQRGTVHPAGDTGNLRGSVGTLGGGSNQHQPRGNLRGAMLEHRPAPRGQPGDAGTVGRIKPTNQHQPRGAMYLPPFAMYLPPFLGIRKTHHYQPRGQPSRGCCQRSGDQTSVQY